MHISVIRYRKTKCDLEVKRCIIKKNTCAASLIIGLIRRRFGWEELKGTLVDTGHITASILFLIIAASMYSRMLGVAGLPTLFGDWLAGTNLSLAMVMALYVLLLVFLGTILDTASIILIVVPLFLPTIEAFGGDLVWFGIVTVIGAEIGLLTPPLGISCFVIKSTINDPNVTLFDVFAGGSRSHSMIFNSPS